MDPGATETGLGRIFKGVSGECVGLALERFQTIALATPRACKQTRTEKHSTVDES